MKTTLKKFMTLACAGALTLSLVACGADAATGDGGATGNAGSANTGSANAGGNGAADKEDSKDGGVLDNLFGEKEWKKVRKDAFQLMGNGQERPTSRTEYEYDDKGNVVKEVVSQAQGNDYWPRMIEEYRYDDAGQVVWERSSEFRSGTWTYTWKEFEFDEKGTVRKISAGAGNSSSDTDITENKAVDNLKEVAEFDADGNKIKVIRTGIEADGTEWTCYRYEVDENGKVICDMSYSSKDTPFDGYEYFYDESGRVVKYTRGYNTGTLETTTYTYEDTATGYLQRACKVEARRNDDGTLQEPKFEEGTDYEYDANGYLVKVVTYEQEASFEQRHSFYWEAHENDAAGNCIKIIDYKGDFIEYTYEYTYDEAGNRIKYLRYTGDGAFNVWYEYAYDATGNEVKHLCMNEDGTIKDGYTYEYDRYGNVSKEVRYDKGVISRQEEYVYAADGTLLKEVKKEGENGERITYWYEMDEAGNMLKDLKYKEDGNIKEGEEWTYDENGNLLEWKRYYAGEATGLAVYHYESGLLARMEETNKGNLVCEEFYTYDKNDNLTEMTQTNYMNGKVANMLRYTYEYEEIKIAK